MQEETASIVVQVQPNASQNKIVRFESGTLHLRIAAPPIKGKANQELIRFLSDILGVSKTNLSIVKGMTSRRKVVTIKGLTKEEVRRRLEGELSEKQAV